MPTLTDRGSQIIDSIRTRHARKAGLQEADRIGVVASFGRSYLVKAKGSSPPEIISTATTDDLDLDGERVLPDGADWSYFEKNGNVFLDHSYASQNAVARLRSIKRVGNGWLMRAALINDPDNECVRCVQALAEAGGLGVSIGFKVQNAGPPTPDEQKAYPDTDYIVRNWAGIEVSYTAMPCNVACQTHAVIYGEDGDQKAARARDILTKGKVPESIWEGVGVAPSKPRRVIVCVGGLQA